MEKNDGGESPKDSSPPNPSPAPEASPPPPPPASDASPPGNSTTSPPPPPPSQPNSPAPTSSQSPPPLPPKQGSPSSSPPPPPPQRSGTPSGNTTSPPSGSNPVAPAAPGRSTHPSRGAPAAQNSPPSSGSSGSDSSPSSDSGPIIAGVVVAGAVAVAFLLVWLMCSKKKKKQPYYMDHGRPPKDAYYNGSSLRNNPNPEHVVKVPPPPGGMAGPGGGWAAAPLTPDGNASSEYSSNFGHNPASLPPPSPGLGGFNKSQFRYEELAAATGGFSQANLLGQGGFGYVHKGVLTDGREVAVKSLKSGSGQGEREFQAEVEIISRVHHRHLVSLVGYCIADGQRMLVYEFVTNKTLEFHLHGKGQPVMDWAVRLRIALGSAKGLAYLHEDCYPKIIHRDIKAANILLDDKFEAMVADFGLAKLSSDNYTHVSTRVMGTFGYLAPEYASSGKLTEKSDVFSYGVMLLELITGKRPVDPTNKFMEDSLVDWARPLLSKALEDGDYSETVDPRLEGNYVAHEMARMIAAAAACIRHSARRRPKMSQIVHALDGDSSLEDLNNGPKQNQKGGFGSQGAVESQTYDTRMYNADMNRFRKMIMNTQEYNSSEFGATSDYGLNPSASSSDSRESAAEHQKPKPSTGLTAGH
ncbi:proline-rich receptor-like protein kinase PERK15 isoform X2 [Coffea arabica]|uniref:non-specific serine/threonine protein kinase n=1 Tax=Coffea arabica TaxID=13443 RepID=A0ABM4V3Q7_COFAR|nr:proline-rich receptor-like protein kinase PERK7 [Coffea arabica]